MCKKYGCFSCLISLCFPKAAFFYNRVLGEVQNRRKMFVRRRRGLPQNDSHLVISMLEGGMTVNDVAVSFGVHRTKIWRLPQRSRTTGAVKDRPRSGWQKRLTPREKRKIRSTAGRDHFLPATRIFRQITKYGGHLKTVLCPRKQSAINVKHQMHANKM